MPLSSLPDDAQRLAWLWPALLLAALTAVAYVPAMNGGFIWDDDDYVQDNPTLRSLQGLEQIWLQPGATRQYYPLVHTTYWIEYRLWGLNPTGYHVFNVLLQLVSAWDTVAHAAEHFASSENGPAPGLVFFEHVFV